jgi:hypothetical protein
LSACAAGDGSRRRAERNVDRTSTRAGRQDRPGAATIIVGLLALTALLVVTRQQDAARAP